MPSFKDWVSAARLRTLPLSLSGVIVSSCFAHMQDKFSWSVCIWVFLTTLFLQVLSNYANDYGDTQNGADSDLRVGPLRAVQSGVISQKQMKSAVYLMGTISFFSGIILLYISFGSFTSPYFIGFIGLGILAIIAAYTYTAGSKPYGYIGLGDVSVFVFFGLVSVCGSYFLYSKELSFHLVLLAASIGMLATGVLNLNNIRDLDSDSLAGKITIPVKLGKKYAVVYQCMLLIISFLLIFYYNFLQNKYSWHLFCIFIIVLWNVLLVKFKNPDGLLKVLALSTLAISLLIGLSF
ncbi:MAG: 1,4-dihydroxy-2-naphthoate octaprenyltransferase [Leadbetterella sp.]